MKRIILAIGWLIGVALICTFTYGAYLIHPGLGLMVGVVWALAQMNVFQKQFAAGNSRLDVSIHPKLEEKAKTPDAATPPSIQ